MVTEPRQGDGGTGGQGETRPSLPVSPSPRLPVTKMEATERLSILQVLEKGLFSTGSVVQMFQLARGLAGRGHRVAIVSRPEGQVPEEARREGLEFIALALRHEFDLASARRLAKSLTE